MNHDAADLLYRQGLLFMDRQPSPARLGIINAAAGPMLTDLTASADTHQLQQTSRVDYLALAAQRLNACNALSGTFDCILLLPGKQRTQTLAWMASAMQKLTDGGVLVVCCPNRMGARTYERKLHELSGNISSMSKARCRLFSARRTTDLDKYMAGKWEQKAAPRLVPQLGLYSRPGLFSWDRPDPGSRLLLSSLPSGLSGTGMDLCCGYGYLATGILARSNAVDTLYLADAEQTALGCARMNLPGTRQLQLNFNWLDATAEMLPGKPDWIVLNPPFHAGRERAVRLGQQIIMAACGALKRGGRLYLVANRKLPYESVLKQRLRRFRYVCEEQGYKVVHGMK